MKKFICLPLVTFLATMALATPSTQIWNPSTDIQATGVMHFGIDNYFTLVGPAAGGYAYPTDVGLTYGLVPGVEIGIDVFEPQAAPFVGNLKYGIPENGNLPALAIGGYGLGTQAGVTDQNVLYGVAAKTFPLGRITVGYFAGNGSVLVDGSGNKDNAGLILTWDKVVNDKLWLCVDYAGTNSVLGAAFAGFSFVFAPNTSVIFGYGSWNNGAKPTVTTQLDINL
ncbi:MAG: hypothetical protein QME05_06670 [Candidatus Margulisbacteria bacterium]|nr:hypothetical protein [Candidatus Margulisiibacteriota bacterium]